jgi:hypothetical protein
MSKICTTCGLEKPLSEFHIANDLKDGHCYHCKECKSNYDKNYYGNEPWKRTLIGIKQRCENPNQHKFPIYGGRGIKCLITEEELKTLWFRDKAYLLKEPSIDRIDNDGNYCFSNCQYIEFDENSIKDRSKPVLQFDKQGNFIREWESGTVASKTLHIQHSSISDCCNSGKQKTAGKFIWKFKN